MSAPLIKEMGDGEHMPPRQSLIHQQNLWKTFFVFLLPLIATNILQNLSGTINTIFVGQMMGVDAIAAVSVFSLFYSCCSLLLSEFRQVPPC